MMLEIIIQSKNEHEGNNGQNRQNCKFKTMIWSKGTRIIPNFIGLTFWDGVGKGEEEEDFWITCLCRYDQYCSCHYEKRKKN